jgi:hypothetical protein
MIKSIVTLLIAILSIGITEKDYNKYYSNVNIADSDKYGENYTFTIIFDYDPYVCDTNYNYIRTVFSNNGNINKGRFYNNSSTGINYIFEFYINGESSETDYQSVTVAYFIN